METKRAESPEKSNFETDSSFLTAFMSQSSADLKSGHVLNTLFPLEGTHSKPPNRLHKVSSHAEELLELEEVFELEKSKLCGRARSEERTLSAGPSWPQNPGRNLLVRHNSTLNFYISPGSGPCPEGEARSTKFYSKAFFWEKTLAQSERSVLRVHKFQCLKAKIPELADDELAGCVVLKKSLEDGSGELFHCFHPLDRKKVEVRVRGLEWGRLWAFSNVLPEALFLRSQRMNLRDSFLIISETNFRTLDNVLREKEDFVNQFFLRDFLKDTIKSSMFLWKLTGVDFKIEPKYVCVSIHNYPNVNSFHFRILDSILVQSQTQLLLAPASHRQAKKRVTHPQASFHSIKQIYFEILAKYCNSKRTSENLLNLNLERLHLELQAALKEDSFPGYEGFFSRNDEDLSSGLH